MLVPHADRAGELLANLKADRCDGNDLEGRVAPDPVPFAPSPVPLSDVDRLFGRNGGTRVHLRVAPGLGPDEDEVAVIDRGEQAPMADRNSVDLLGERHLPEVLVRPSNARVAELSRIDAEDPEVTLDEAPDCAHDDRGVDPLERLAEAFVEIGNREVVSDAGAG